MDSGIRILFALVALTLFSFVSSLEAPTASRSKRSVLEIDNPRETLQVLGTLAQRILESENLNNEKRGLDFGLSRGFSGSQAAKHLMGLSAASFANGPGRRRRFVDDRDNE